MDINRWYKVPILGSTKVPKTTILGSTKSDLGSTKVPIFRVILGGLYHLSLFWKNNT